MSANPAIQMINETMTERPLRRSQVQLAKKDLIDGLSQWWLWKTMAWQDIRQRYRGSMLGPFWLTISMSIMVLALGILYSALWKMDIAHFLPYLTTGLLYWNLISSLVSDGTSAFTKAEGLMLQVKMPVTVHVMRSVVRNFIIFLHNCVVVIAVLLFFAVPQSLYSLVSFIGLAIILLNGFWITMLIGLLCARFRDIGPIVSSLIQIVFFVTPIIWMPTALGNKAWLLTFNPAYVFLEIARGPLVGDTVPLSVWAMAAAITAAGFVGTFFFFARFRSRLPFWL